MENLSGKQIKSNKQRLESIARLKQEYQQRKSIVKNALANIDTKPKNKIIFNEDGDNEQLSSEEANFEKECEPERSKTSSLQNKFKLFEEDENEENEDEYNFEVREHLQGKKGKKLMELQSKFKNDKRFAMDARFLDDQTDEEGENEKEVQEDEENNYDDEKEKNMEILEQVLGKKVSRKPTANNKPYKSMVRFDPSLPEHSKYELKSPKKQEKNKRKRDVSETEIETKTVEEMPKPEVSKERFYKVNVNLKDAFHSTEEFSLANLFQKDIVNDEEEEEEQKEPTEDKPKEIKKKKKLNHERNPFRYDSSTDEENEDDETIQKNGVINHIQKTNPSPFERKKPIRTETFFFKEDDYRLQEGYDFIKKMALEEVGDFSSMRRTLKKIVRAKVKNNQRNSRPFKRKLGGKKRLRVKRALKR